MAGSVGYIACCICIVVVYGELMSLSLAILLSLLGKDSGNGTGVIRRDAKGFFMVLDKTYWIYLAFGLRVVFGLGATHRVSGGGGQIGGRCVETDVK
jgi:hypothetical protein